MRLHIYVGGRSGTLGGNVDSHCQAIGFGQNLSIPLMIV